MESKEMHKMMRVELWLRTSGLFPKLKSFLGAKAKLGSRAKRSKHDGKVLFPCSSHFCSCYYYVLGPSAFIWPFQSNLRWKTLKTRLRSALAHFCSWMKFLKVKKEGRGLGHLKTNSKSCTPQKVPKKVLCIKAFLDLEHQLFFVPY